MGSGLALAAAIVLGGGAAAPLGVPLADGMLASSAEDAPQRRASSPGSDRFADVQSRIRARQVQVERRVIVRITPFSARERSIDLDTAFPEASRASPKASSRARGGRCLPINDIAGVRLGRGGALLLFMRDRRVYSASLERKCPVQGFYSGFYVERPEDGMLCPGREALHARSGADCTLGSFREVPQGPSAED